MTITYTSAIAGTYSGSDHSSMSAFSTKPASLLLNSPPMQARIASTDPATYRFCCWRNVPYCAGKSSVHSTSASYTPRQPFCVSRTENAKSSDVRTGNPPASSQAFIRITAPWPMYTTAPNRLRGRMCKSQNGLIVSDMSRPKPAAPSRLGLCAACTKPILPSVKHCSALDRKSGGRCSSASATAKYSYSPHIFSSV